MFFRASVVVQQLILYSVVPVLHMGTGSCASYSTLVQLFAYGWKNKVMVQDPCTSVGDPEAPNDLLFSQLSNSCGDHLGANQLFNKRY